MRAVQPTCAGWNARHLHARCGTGQQARVEGRGEGSLVRQVIQAAYAAFQAGLHVALYVSAGLVLGAGILAAITLATPSAAQARPDR
jgi:hypothetical protein